MYASLRESIEKVAKMANDFFANSPNNMIPTEYAKRKEAWDKFKELPVDYSSSFYSDLINKDVQDEEERQERRNQKEDASVNHLNAIYELGADYWNRLIKEGYERHLLTGKDSDLLTLAVRLHSSKPPYISDKQANAIWQIRERLGKEDIVI